MYNEKRIVYLSNHQSLGLVLTDKLKTKHKSYGLCRYENPRIFCPVKFIAKRWQQYSKGMNKKLTKSILASYLIGLPIGILTIIMTIWIPLLLTGEGLLTIAVVGAYGISTIGLVVSFLIALWFGGKLAYKNINNGNSLILISFKYSIIVNLIIWATFCIIIGLSAKSEIFLKMIPAIIAFIVCTILTTFSIGLLISYVIKRINSKPTQIRKTVANNI